MENQRKVNCLVLSGSIVVNYDGQTQVLPSSDERYEKVLTALREGKDNEIPQILEVKKVALQDGVEVVGGVVKVNGTALPEGLSKKIEEYLALGLPLTALLNFWKKLSKNPSFNTRKELYKFLEKNGHPITENGNFIAYKKVRNDFYDCHSGKFYNGVGEVLRVDRSEVDDNPNNTCSFGLHVASFYYALNFSHGIMLEVEVNPEDSISIPVDYDGSKMRVCGYKVVGTVTEESKELFRSSDIQKALDEKNGYKGSDKWDDNDEGLEDDEELDDEVCDECGYDEWDCICDEEDDEELEEDCDDEECESCDDEKSVDYKVTPSSPELKAHKVPENFSGRVVKEEYWTNGKLIRAKDFKVSSEDEEDHDVEPDHYEDND